MYEETVAPWPLRGVARCVWRSASAGPKRIVPDGCLDLVVGDGAVFVAGPDTAAWSSVTHPGALLRGVRFSPGRAPAVLGVAADELRDRRVPLGELWGREGELLAERLLAGEISPAQAVASRPAEVPPPDPAVAALIARLDAGVARVAEATAMLGRPGSARGNGVGGPEGEAAEAHPGRTRTAQAGGPEGEVTAAHPGRTRTTQVGGPEGVAAAAHPGRTRTTQVGGPEGEVAAARPGLTHAGGPELAAARVEDPAGPAAVSERRLRRRFVQAVGYGPATYLRVTRFQRAVALAPRVPGLAALAVAAGYADQAHLSRECRALTGLTPRAYFPRPSSVDSADRDRLRSA